jgi:putative nucleotidyltransferase with HDIG domain
MTVNLSVNDRTLAPALSGDPAHISTTHSLLSELGGWFHTDFQLFDADTGELIDGAGRQPDSETWMRGRLCRECALRSSAEIIEEEDPLAVLAIPLHLAGSRVVAVGNFATTNTVDDEALARAGRKLGLEPDAAARWLARQMVWEPSVLLSMGQVACERLASDQRFKTLDRELRKVSQHLSATYEEISLLYRLTQNLKLSSQDKDLAELALDWLGEVVPAESLMIQLTNSRSISSIEDGTPGAPVLLTHGTCVLDSAELLRIVDHFGLAAGARPLIVNRSPSSHDDWQWPAVRQLVIVPLSEGTNCFGWLVAVNHSSGGEFGTVEASLLNSVGAILGIHNSNAELYYQQREIFAGVVRALTSAIDAKDPYTCGHSDRVARVAVRLAEQLHCDAKQLETIYLGGLLHDVGKIGIDDNVLRKPGKLTEGEYEHIKTHTEIGHRILTGIKRLDDVLPVVLYHHEQWDGRGYPHGLAGEAIPLLARIVAVADAYDAMGSDRPYRQGMSQDKLDVILRDGAGKQWDATVVDAFFQAREEIREISKTERHGPVDVQNWT